jgi:hypothetical protein
MQKSSGYGIPFPQIRESAISVACGRPIPEGILCTPLWALPRRLEPAAEDDMAVAEWPLTVSLHPQVAISLCSRRRAPDMTDQ